MFHWFNDSGYQADVKGRARDPELQLRTLEGWVHEEGWERKREITVVRRDKLGRPLTQT
jgi:hypothetical protein